MDLSEKVINLEKQLIEKEKEINKLTNRGLKVYEENKKLTANPEIAARMAEMEYQLSMAEKFIKSGAFPSMTPEQAFTIMQAGKEMDMTEIESLNSLYVVKGSIDPYGKAMVSILTSNGWKLSYQEETDNGVTVVATKGDQVISEIVTDADQIIQNSKAAGFSKKNKMRFHGVRMILNFHLPHLIRGTSDLFDEQHHRYEEARAEKRESKFSEILEEE